MKPKQRLEQKQSSRLYLRKKDHREVIMNDIYHNAIWMKKEQDGEEKDELVWVKYPQNALVNISNGSSLGWLDTDRQFNFAIGYASGQRTSRIFGLDKICIALSAYSSIDSSQYTEDGIVWHSFKKNPSMALNEDVMYFGKNGICANFFFNTFITICEFEKDEETEEWSFTQKNVTIPSNAWYLCRTDDGCILGVSNYDRNSNTYTNDFYRVTSEGCEKVNTIMGVKWAFNIRWVRDCSRGSYLGFALIASFSLNDNTYNQILGFTSHNGGYSWEVQELYSQQSGYYESWSYDSSTANMDAFVRDDYMYVIFGDLQRGVHLWRTLTQQWNEVELPSWVDLPLLQSGGKCVSPTTKEKLRIAIRPNETTNADTSVYNLIGKAINNTTRLNRNNYNIKFENGEILGMDQEDEFLVLHNGYVCVFDNLRFISNSKSFAFIQGGYSDSTDGADRLQENDYCVRTVTPTESEVEE